MVFLSLSEHVYRSSSRDQQWDEAINIEGIVPYQDKSSVHQDHEVGSAHSESIQDVHLATSCDETPIMQELTFCTNKDTTIFYILYNYRLLISYVILEGHHLIGL